MTTWQSHVWRWRGSAWSCGNCGQASPDALPPKAECPVLPEPPTPSDPPMHRRIGDYGPTPGASARQDMWRDPERPTLTPVGSLLHELGAAARDLGDDELRVLTYIAGRLAMGARQYGRLDLATDRRDWRVELGQEAADAMVYAACEALTQPTGGER